MILVYKVLRDPQGSILRIQAQEQSWDPKEKEGNLAIRVSQATLDQVAFQVIRDDTVNQAR